GRMVPIYLENLAPLFFIEQHDGWTEIQSRQVGRYRQQEISQVVVEFVLGCVAAIKARVFDQARTLRDIPLRDRARSIGEQVTTLWSRHGWSVDWSGHGTLDDVSTRWSQRTLREALRQEAGVDLAQLRGDLSSQAEKLRSALTTGDLDPSRATAHSAA